MGLRVLTSVDPVGLAASRVADLVSKADIERGSCRIACGSAGAHLVLRRVRETLSDVTWKRVRLAWLEENCVPFWHLESRRGAAYRASVLVNQEPLGFELSLWRDDDSPELAIPRIQDSINKTFGGALDVALVHLGTNGEIGILRRGHTVMKARGGVAFIDGSPGTITLGIDLLRTTTNCVVLANGEERRVAIVRALRGDPSEPLSALKEVVVVTDLSTASLLEDIHRQ